ncbi:hypothetical protein NCAS_0A11680 [Naumovozyma castellii]|uniref:Uncharacterized protein n=1 Tax=Naumovozyma castellii TaxID=27288 RepID=G0V8C8_NAUCA|nr:hypothetical protein NCAS_0A11680 [Naumovozyma castellii CBS 4309]CCC67726.1 hypothetical protein NCAS_0A11680 [Naumovozyma castellii CBS 4309]
MSNLESAITGAIASTMANVIVYPLDVAKTVIQSETKAKETDELSEKDKRILRQENVIRCLIRIFRKRGLRGLYQGMSTSVFSKFVQSFCYFFWYSFLRRKYFSLKLLRNTQARPINSISTVEELIVGVGAAALTQVVNNPIEVILTKQQTTDDKDNVDFYSVLKQIYVESNGKLSSYWKGFKVSLILTVNPSITFAAYQRFKDILLKQVSNSEKSYSGQLTVNQNFILGALAKIISTIITQPLIVAKVSLQRSNSKFKHFEEVLRYLYKEEGVLALWKGVGPQLTKGVLVQGLVFAFKGELTKSWKRLLFILNLLIRRVLVLR